MCLDFTFNFWDSLFSTLGIIIGAFVAIRIYQLSNRLTATDKYKHEIRITERINEIGLNRDVILADTKKYHPLRDDGTNETYYKQAAGLHTIIPEYGVQFILRGSEEGVVTGLVPFDWIEYIRDYDSEDNKCIIVCKFKGVKWHSNFKSPFTELGKLYLNPHFNERSDPYFLKYTSIKPDAD